MHWKNVKPLARTTVDPERKPACSWCFTRRTPPNPQLSGCVLATTLLYAWLYLLLVIWWMSLYNRGITPYKGHFIKQPWSNMNILFSTHSPFQCLAWFSQRTSTCLTGPWAWFYGQRRVVRRDFSAYCNAKTVIFPHFGHVWQMTCMYKWNIFC